MIEKNWYFVKMRIAQQQCLVTVCIRREEVLIKILWAKLKRSIILSIQEILTKLPTESMTIVINRPTHHPTLETPVATACRVRPSEKLL